MNVNMKKSAILFGAVVLGVFAAVAGDDNRIAAMKADKLGMFIHWGIYAIPAKGEWLMYREQIPAEKYDKLADEFKQPASFSPRQWVQLAKKMGAKYAVLTTRHHDGFCLFDTKTTDFNSVKTAAKRDYVREFAEACRAEGIRVGFYYSIMNWQFNHSPNGVFDQKVWDAQVVCTHEALRELMTNYGKVDYLWYDGCSAPGSTDAEMMEKMWRISDLNAMVRKLQPGILINDRSATPQDYATPEQCLTPPPRGRMWESCITCNGMWGYQADDNNWKSSETLFRSLLHCARFGGNILINIGPRADGSVPEPCVKALEGLGERIAKCPEAIYGSERDAYTEATHEAGVVTKANGSYWLWALNSDRLDGAEKLEKVADGVYKVTLKEGAKPCNWLGGRHDVEIKAGSAPILGDDTGREAPPSGAVEPLDLPEATEVAFDLPAGGSWRLDVGYVNADGFKDTFTKTVTTEAAGRVMVAIPSGKGIYARRQTPVWNVVAPRTWQVAGTFKDRYYETRFSESAVKETYAKDLLKEAAKAKFVPVPEDNLKADKSDVRVNLNYSSPMKEIGYAFAKRIVRSATDRTVYAAVGMDWWSKVYVNGKLAHDYASGWKPKAFPLTLKKGDNEILVITHGGCRQHWFSFFMNASESVFEATGPVTDKTPGFRFGNITFTDKDRTRAKFEKAEFNDRTCGRLTTGKLRLPHKEPGKGAYFKFSFDAQYTFTSGKGGAPQRCNQGVFFYDKQGRVLPDCYDTMYPGETAHHYERVLYAWDEVDTFEVFFQKPWAMKAKDGDTCTLNVSDLKIESAMWEDAAAYCDATYAKLPPLAFKPQGDWTKLIPRTMDALKTGKPWRVVMLGDSIMQDTFNSQFHALVKRAFPLAKAEWILSMRGGTGCWHYILAENFFPYVVDHQPDLLIIGGISNGRKHDETANGRDVGPTGPDAMVRVGKLARERLGCEVLIVNNPLSVDFRQYDEANPSVPLPKQGFSVHQYEHIRNSGWDYGQLKNLCAGEKIQWWDEFEPCYKWLFGSGLPSQYYSRDAVHSGELGKQIIGHVMYEYFMSAR